MNILKVNRAVQRYWYPLTVGLVSGLSFHIHVQVKSGYITKCLLTSVRSASVFLFDPPRRPNVEKRLGFSPLGLLMAPSIRVGVCQVHRFCICLDRRTVTLGWSRPRRRSGIIASLVSNFQQTIQYYGEMYWIFDFNRFTCILCIFVDKPLWWFSVLQCSVKNCSSSPNMILYSSFLVADLDFWWVNGIGSCSPVIFRFKMRN